MSKFIHVGQVDTTEEPTSEDMYQSNNLFSFLVCSRIELFNSRK